MDNKQRTSDNRRDDNLEEILTTLNSILDDDEKELIKQFQKPTYPPVFIVGNARSGTTLLYQWLASTSQFAYPSNIISRFYNAPYIGALIHKAFVDFDKFGEIFGEESITYKSKLGKTKSAVSPHEFWYFWRRFFQFGEIQKLSDEELKKIDSDSFLKELAAIEGAFEKPLLMKGMILNWNLDYLVKLIPNAIFIHIKREPIFNMHSLYNARLKYFGDVKKWYSFKPPEYKDLKLKDVYEQLAGQVYYTDHIIEETLADYKSYIRIDYEKFCERPIRIIEDLHELAPKHFEVKMKEDEMEFSISNTIINESFNKSKSLKALQKFYK